MAAPGVFISKRDLPDVFLPLVDEWKGASEIITKGLPVGAATVLSLSGIVREGDTTSAGLELVSFSEGVVLKHNEFGGLLIRLSADEGNEFNGHVKELLKIISRACSEVGDMLSLALKEAEGNG